MILSTTQILIIKMSKLDHERPSLRHKKKKIFAKSEEVNKGSISSLKLSKTKVFKYGKPKLLRRGKVVD